MLDLRDRSSHRANPRQTPPDFCVLPRGELRADRIRESCESGRQFCAGLDVELVEHMGEMALDRAGGDKQGLGDLAVRQPFGGQLGDATLAGGECFEPGKQCSAGPGPSCAQFDLGSKGQRLGTEVVGGVDCLAERLARLDSAVAATKECTEVGQGAAGRRQIGPIE